jgi:phosphoenolpyruvate-protein kinase (PTS system EI component)
MSVVPGILPEIKKIVRSLRYDRLREIAAEVLKFPTAEESESYLRNFLREEIPDLPLDNDPAP